MVKRVPSARAKADSNIQPIAPTSSPTIGNILVVVVSCIPFSVALYVAYKLSAINFLE